MFDSTLVPMEPPCDSVVISEWVKAYAYAPLKLDNPYAAQLCAPEAKRWVNWRFVPNPNDDDKPRKLLRTPDDRYASSTDPSTWRTFREVVASQNSFDGVGFVFAGDVLGVDLDHVFDGETPPRAREFLEKANTYTDWSPSRAGAHVYFHLSEPLELEKHRQTIGEYHPNEGYECYTAGRFFTFTGEPYGEPKPVRTISANEAVELLKILEYPWKEADGKMRSRRINATSYVSPIPDDTKLVEKARAAANGKKFSDLYDRGDWKACGYPSQSEADQGLCHMLSFWTGKDAARMDRIFRTSKLMRNKWDEKRRDSTYGRATIEKAVQRCNEVYDGANGNRSPGDEEPAYLMSGGKDSKPLLVLENICRVLERDGAFDGTFRLNEFSSMTEVYESKANAWVLLGDGFIFDAIRHISVNYPAFAKVGKEIVTDAILSIASHNKANPPRGYLLSLLWDGTPRLDTWLCHAYGVPDDTIHREIGANWLKGLVSRIMRPGCQYDHVLALESEQGWNKSSSLRALGEPWHVEITASPDNKDFFLILAQNVIVEFSEGDIISRTDVKKLKGIITKVQDQVRLPYARGVSTLKRGCVFAMTTNDTEYLKDETGNRRWLPVKLGKIADVEWIRANRDQLYAEAFHRAINLGETSYEFSDAKMLKDMQESRRERNDYEEDVVTWYLGLSEYRRDNGIRAIEVYREVIAPGTLAKDFVREVPRIVQLQIIGMLRGALGLENKDVRDGENVFKRWLPTENTQRKFDLGGTGVCEP